MYYRIVPLYPSKALRRLLEMVHFFFSLNVPFHVRPCLPKSSVHLKKLSTDLMWPWKTLIFARNRIFILASSHTAKERVLCRLLSVERFIQTQVARSQRLASVSCSGFPPLFMECHSMYSCTGKLPVYWSVVHVFDSKAARSPLQLGLPYLFWVTPVASMEVF